MVLAPQPQPTPEAPFYEERPSWWNPAVVEPPVGIPVPSAPELPPELLKPGAREVAAWQDTAGADRVAGTLGRGRPRCWQGAGV